MEILTPFVGPVGDVLASLRRKSFPGLSSDEADTFTLGFWAGEMATAIRATEDTISADEIAERLETELKRIERGIGPSA